MMLMFYIVPRTRGRKLKITVVVITDGGEFYIVPRTRGRKLPVAIVIINGICEVLHSSPNKGTKTKNTFDVS